LGKPVKGIWRISRSGKEKIILFNKRKYINVAIFFIILALSNQNNFPYEPVR